MPINRREFITWSIGGAFLLAAGPAAPAQQRELSPWIRIERDGRVRLYSTVSDMGQGARTGQIQILADELEVDWNAIVVEMAPDADPYRDDGELFSGGSRSIRTRYEVLRKAGASAREQLLRAAAARWSVPTAACQAALGYIVHARTGRRLGYGELAAEAASFAPPNDPPLKPAGARRYIGKAIATLGQDDKIAGRAVYGIDVRVPDMLHATLRQCPVFGGSLQHCDGAPALAVAGVRKVVMLPAAVAVVADDTWAAFRGAQALAPEWNVPSKLTDSSRLVQQLRDAYDAVGAEISPRDGGKAMRASLRSHFSESAKTIEATYELPYLSHSPLEPMNATARVSADRVEIWAPTQAQTAVRRDVAKALARPVDEVLLHTTCLGGGFGRRLKTDYAVFAALVAREVDVPVQLTWTREEDLAHDFYRPAAVLTCRAVLEAGKPIRGYEMIGATTNDTVFGGTSPAPYDIGEYAVTQTMFDAGVPVGAWRSVDASISIFAKESFIDECAGASGVDALEYRRRLLGGNRRALRVLDHVAGRIGWSAHRGGKTGKGLALFEGWDTIVAHAIEVRVDGEKLKVLRIVVAADPGTVINPAQARAQFEGGALMALSAALAEEINVREGRVEQSNFDSYRLLRMNQAPLVDVTLLETTEAKIGGIGEPPIPGVAAALANAIFNACGKRIRKLPIRTSGLIV
jgi:isoquinoline 1-oxidoreductase beta subunit